MLLPVFMLLLGLFAVGIGWIAAALQVYLRDTAQVLAVILTLWFWATPILLHEDKFHAAGRSSCSELNPLTYIVRAYREILLGHAVPLLRIWGSTRYVRDCGVRVRRADSSAI